MKTIMTIRITKLFNLFNYSIDLKDGGVTILTGPNGYGKTTILKIIHAFANKNVLFFFNLVFERIEFVTETSLFSLEKKKSIIIICENDEKIGEVRKNTVEKAMEEVSRETPYHRLDENRWIDARTDEILGFDYILNKLSVESPSIFKKFKSPIPNTFKVYLIREQRLLRRIEKIRSRRYYGAHDEYSTQFGDAIEEYARELKSYILRTESRYSQISQDLDSSFPRRLFEQKGEVSEQEFNERFENIKDIQKSLTKYELSIIREDNHPTYKKENSKALLIYLEDTEKKLSVFSELINRLDLFTDILNERRFSFKKIKINKQCGFKFETIIDNKDLSLIELSSGEQQEVILLYELLFKTEKGTLVLIDEPEISLHVAWQKGFLEDLKKVVEVQGINVAIATHSPQIINENWNLTIDLEELKNETVS